MKQQATHHYLFSETKEQEPRKNADFTFSIKPREHQGIEYLLFFDDTLQPDFTFTLQPVEVSTPHDQRHRIYFDAEQDFTQLRKDKFEELREEMAQQFKLNIYTNPRLLHYGLVISKREFSTLPRDLLPPNQLHESVLDTPWATHLIKKFIERKTQQKTGTLTDFKKDLAFTQQALKEARETNWYVQLPFDKRDALTNFHSTNTNDLAEKLYTTTYYKNKNRIITVIKNLVLFAGKLDHLNWKQL